MRPCLTVYLGPPAAGYHRRNPRGKSFENDEAESVRLRRENQNVKIGEHSRQFGSRQHALEFSLPQVVAKPSLLRALSHHYDPKVAMAHGQKSLFKPRERTDALLRCEASHISDLEGTALAIAKPPA